MNPPSDPQDETHPERAAVVAPSQPAAAAKGGDFYKVGTLLYTKAGIAMLFFWLFWNDACFMLMEHVAPQLTPLLLKSHGASNKEIALYLSTIVGLATIWINPVISTYSDRFRHPLGRRRPFLLAATPFCALFLAAIPFAPDCMPFLMKIPGFSLWFGPGHFNGIVLLIGLCFLAYAIFNSVLQALFSYYFWDVVPEALLGRFSALTKIISMVTNFIWNYFCFGLAERHMKGVYVACALVFLVVYLLSVWKVKEGDYPPPDHHEKGSIFAPIRIYFVECFSQSYFLWFFAAHAIYQIGNLSNMYQIFFFHNDLGLTLDTVGKMRSWPSLAIVLLAYPIGKLIDYMNPIRMMTPVLFIWAASNIVSFFFLNGKWSLFFCLAITTIANFPFAICLSALTVEVFPREKLGQFCSANQITSSVSNFFLSIAVGALFDYIKNYRYVFLWSAFFQVLAGLAFLKVYYNWRQVKGHPPVPHVE